MVNGHFKAVSGLIESVRLKRTHFKKIGNFFTSLLD
jgi:hypothetical protein